MSSTPPPETRPRLLFGAMCALGGAACWGASNPFCKLILDQGIEPLEASGVLYVGSALGLALLLLLRRVVAPGIRPARVQVADRPWLLAAAIVGGGIAPFLMMYGAKHTSGLATALLIAVEPPATALIAVAMFGERLTRRLALGGAIVLAGAILVGVKSAQGGAGAPDTTALGAMAVASACTLWGLDSSLQTRVAHLDPVFVAMSKGTIAGPLTLGLAAALRGTPFWQHWTTTHIVQMLAVGFVGYGIGIALMVRAFRELGAARTGALFASTTLFAAGAAVVVLRETPTPFFFVAAGILAVGVLTIVTEKHQAP
jgi:drug/metabolite transporter (DMT)-like permease